MTPESLDMPDMPLKCDERQFAAAVERMVADHAPRLFAVVQEYGERVAAWGFAFEDHAEVMSVDGGMRMRMDAPEAALDAFRAGRHVQAQLVWCP